MLSSKLIDAQAYDSRNINNYKESSIRSWLTDDFYNKAFYFNDKHLCEMEVVNNAGSTGSGSNPFATDNTYDKVCLLSYSDYTNGSFGFHEPANIASSSRCCKTTDYARGRGACISTDYQTKFNGHYWTRSPNSGNLHYASYVRTDGVIHYDNNVSYSYLCVRPAIFINLVIEED